MWDDKKSLILSKICVKLFMAALVACVFLAPVIYVKWFKLDRMSEGREAYFIITLCLGYIPAVLLLVFLHSLLNRIGAGDVFINKNVACLRHISWCCFAGAVIGLASSFYWLPWFAVGVAAAFMGLIVRVIKNVVAKAVSLQDDADYTI